MSTLKTIQTISEVAKILSIIVLVACIIGTVGCIIGAVGIACIPADMEVDGETIREIIERESDMTIDTIYASLISVAIMCLGEAIVARFALSYFKNELEAGTPFTFEGARELKKVGIVSIVAPIVAFIICTVITAVMDVILGDVDSVSFGNEFSITFGIMMIIMSVICKYGAELQKKLD